MRIRDRLASAAASLLESAALMDPYATAELATQSAAPRPAPTDPVRRPRPPAAALAAAGPPVYRPLPLR